MRTWLLLALGLLFARPLYAQDTSVRLRSASLEWLGDRMDRRDDNISPGRFGGMMWGGRVGYGGEGPSHRTSISAEFRAGSLSGSIGNGSTQSVFDARIAGSYVRPMRVARVGAELGLRGSVFAHTYGLSGFSGDYGLLLVSLSPVIDWDHGVWRVRVTSPLVSLVSRPYSRINITRGRLPIHIAGPTELRAINAYVTYTAASTRRAAFRASYGLEVMSIARDDGLAAVENRFAVGVLWRFGHPR